MMLGRALALFTLLISVCLAAPAWADTVVVKNPDGSKMELINVDVAEYRNIIGRGTFFISTGPGAPPSEATTSRVRSIDFGAGQPVELFIGDAPPGRRFAATLHRYEGEQLVASPEGSTDRFQVPIEKVISFRGTGGRRSFPAPPTASSNAGFGAPPAALAETDAPSADPFGSAEAGSSAVSPTSADQSGSAHKGISAEHRALIEAKFDRFRLASRIAMLSFIMAAGIGVATWIWTLVDACKNSRVVWGIVIALSGCFLIKFFYFSVYEGRHKSVLLWLLISEVIFTLGMMLPALSITWQS